jgi:hypothetical protein
MVEVIHYETANKNKTIGYVDIRVPIMKPTVLVLRKIAHVQSGDRRWFNYPSFSREINGQPSFFKFFEFETQIYNGQLLESLSDNVKDYCKRNGIEGLEPMNFDTFPESTNELPF